MNVNEFVTTTELLAAKSASAIVKVMMQKAANDLERIRKVNVEKRSEGQ